MAKVRKKTQIRKTPLKKKNAALQPDGSLFDRLRLRNIRLVDLVSHLEIRDGRIPSVANIESAATVGPSPDNKLLVDMRLALTGTPKDAGEDSSRIKIEVHYQCVYEVPEGDPKEFEGHAADIAKVGMLILWPHIRELVQSITSRMSIPPFVLPIFAPGGKGDNVVTLAGEPPAKKPPRKGRQPTQAVESD